MKRGSTDGGRLRRMVQAPIRALCRARDKYVSSMTGLTAKASYHGVVGYRGGAATGHPWSYRFHPPRTGSSGGGGEDDLGELVRAASQGSVGPPKAGCDAVGGSVAPRSQSAGMGRIDEDEPCDSGGDATAIGLVCPPRSRNRPVAERTVGAIS